MGIDWIAAVTTIIAALITAANLGARVTGSGFVGYTLASGAWIANGAMNDFEPLSVIVMHGFLVFINLFGVWRWLGRQRRYEDSREHAHKRTRWARVPTLFSAGATVGATVKRRHGEDLGEVVDAMFDCDGKRIAYLVISEGGIAGAGETLRAVPPAHLQFEKDAIYTDLSEQAWRELPPIEDDHWPTKAPEPVKHVEAAAKSRSR